ncbi:glycoside hydrolase family 73 protein [Paenibacillus sp. YYML68]|uniref:glycoside hydrolase family 73 protein n=1 Tax=Paenibacillus sp. YYML68 TaxID=2909250 RepID=UPI00249257D9|nr:glycoside hydrolase family 73 protein [Paenibacillus sp. YYML68]
MMTPQQFIDAISEEAVTDMQRTGVLASITIAQAALETGYGQYARGNNLFGIKAKGSEPQQRSTTSEYVNGRWIQVNEGFRIYDSWSESISDHSSFLRTNPIYTRAGFFVYSELLDYKNAARALQTAGYATDPQYANKLISIIERYRLYEFDRRAAEEGGWIPMQLKFDWQWKQLGDALDGLYQKGLITDRRWVERAYNRELTVTELAWLNTIMIARSEDVNV